MMTGESSLWDLGAKGREKMDTACRGTGWNSSGEQGWQIIAYAVVNVADDGLGLAAPSFLGKVCVRRRRKVVRTKGR